MKYLALWTQVGATPPYHDALNWCAAPGTVFTDPMGHIKLVMGSARLPIRAYIVTDTGAFILKGFHQYPADRVKKSLDLSSGKALRRSQRMDFRIEECFISIHVAYTRNYRLVKEYGFYRRFPVSQKVREDINSKVIVQRFRS